MKIVPFISVGDLHFSDSREKIRKKVGEEFSSGVKGEGDYKDFYDYFQQSEFFVYYDKENKINAFEFFKPNPTFEEFSLFKFSYPQIVKLFLELDSELIVDYNNFTSIKYGIGGNTNDDPDDDKAEIEAIIVFRDGYYDPLNIF